MFARTKRSSTSPNDEANARCGSAASVLLNRAGAHVFLGSVCPSQKSLCQQCLNCNISAFENEFLFYFQKYHYVKFSISHKSPGIFLVVLLICYNC